MSDSKIGQIWASLRPLKSNCEFCVDEYWFGMPQAFKKCVTLNSTLSLGMTLSNSIWANFHICQLLPVNQTAYIIYVVKACYNLEKSLTPSKSEQEKIPGKNRIRKIREKSGYQIFVILGLISRMDTINYCFMV